MLQYGENSPTDLDYYEGLFVDVQEYAGGSGNEKNSEGQHVMTKIAGRRT